MMPAESPTVTTVPTRKVYHTDLVVGGVRFANNVLDAPMAGISDIPTRALARRFGAGFTCTEMISAIGWRMAPARTVEFYRRGPDEPLLGLQIAGADPALMEEAARFFTGEGHCEILDVNLGCPVRKIVAGGAGAAMLLDPVATGKVFAATVRGSSVPVTIKMRIGFDEKTRTGLEIARIAEAEGIAMIAVHGRLRENGHSGPVDYAAIAEMVSAVRIPVIANGGIHSPEDAEIMLRNTGAAGVMVGRGAFGRPWIFRDILAHLRGEPVPPPPTVTERIALVLEHCEYANALEAGAGDAASKTPHALLPFRKHLLWYTKGWPGSASLRERLKYVFTPADVERLLADWRAAHPDVEVLSTSAPAPDDAEGDA